MKVSVSDFSYVNERQSIGVIDMETVEQFLARGGKISTVNEGVRALTPKEMWAKSRGEGKSSSYTDAQMREAENMGHLDCLELRHEMGLLGEI